MSKEKPLSDAQKGHLEGCLGALGNTCICWQIQQDRAKDEHLKQLIREVLEERFGAKS